MPKPKATKEAIVPEKVFTRELSNAEKFYIEQKRDQLSAEDIASDLDIPVDVVNNHITLLNDDTHKEPTMFDRAIAKKKHGNAGVVIMTEGASEQIDEAYQNIKPPTPKYVFQPKPSK